MDGIQVELPQMLEARENRVWRQRELLQTYDGTLICFTMNIAGPIKNNDCIRRGFLFGVQLLKSQLQASGMRRTFEGEINAVTGNEWYCMVDADARAVKAITAELEDALPVGRLFDMDVLRRDGKKVDRTELGLPPRNCLLCGNVATACARNRTHTVAQLQEKTQRILCDLITEQDTHRIAELACRSLLFEVGTTPKPGLVDRRNSGSHRDMNVFTFFSSAAALFPYFMECAEIGRKTAQEPAPAVLPKLRWAGKLAEHRMYQATNDVNTHKGAIFSVGIVCAALGRMPRTVWNQPEQVLRTCAAIVAGITAQDFAGLTRETAQTVGQKLYVEYGITGVRGQAEAGFPAVLQAGLPTLEEGMRRGLSINAAGCAALLAIIAADTDTNLIARSDRQTQLAVVEQIQTLLHTQPFPDEDTLKALDEEFIRRNLSPGGSADLLAMSYLLYFLKCEEDSNV